MVRLPLSPEEIVRGKLLGQMLRRARGERPMLAVAMAAGISPETLRKIESGRVPTPSFSTVAMLSMVLGLSLDTVWQGIHEESSDSVPRVQGEHLRKAS
ncbi:helix-turn-helix transcriptional regulator [Arthrobacter sp. LAPM80]|uniref:helix-turn-helix domain-containing protein n=1 Tax=Arthrobacter sp. LAPM80 TaxID=3141788 RepID=UPI00398BAE52